MGTLIKASSKPAETSLETMDALKTALINIDRPKIAQVVRSLVSKALESSPKGSTVTINCR
jgi:signal transduction histidine kinase